MEYTTATEIDVKRVSELVQQTIAAVYPKYYPKEVVDFFIAYHNEENIRRDIENGKVNLLWENSILVGTGSRDGNHITRVYVAPAYQGRGYGRYIIQKLEEEIGLKHGTVRLDASLPASALYERLGYRTLRHESLTLENGAVLVYEVMEKALSSGSSSINYNGRFFVAKENSENGEVSDQTIFAYHQTGSLLWADYAGGEIMKGHLIGQVSKDGSLDFYYQHMNQSSDMKIGKCHSVPRLLENGKIELSEIWQWLSGDHSAGTSILIER
ncbi:GNAT family N-acetyltransferase [Oscillospiraceae bacterium MB08-C2-2]|nr:GNAT family N-acetyltransferase [Oscillospiraceae bacterium MB08-C2-2]